MKQTLHQSILEIAEKYPNKIALYYKKGGSYVGMTYKELKRETAYFASALLGLGAEKGDRVAILSSNRPEWVISDLAVMGMGAISVPVHVTLSPKIIKHILMDSESKILIVNNQLQLNKVLLIEKKILTLKKIIYMDIDNPDISTSKPLLFWDDCIRNGKKQNLKPKYEMHHNDIATIVYTSGTTDNPKGVMLTHYNILSNARAATDYVPIYQKDIFLSFLPLSHILERTAGYYAPLLHGATIAYAENIKTLPQNFKEIKPTVVISVPRIFEKLFETIWERVKLGNKHLREFFVWALKQESHGWRHWISDIIIFKKIRRSLGGRLRLTISGGATLNPKLAKFYERIGIKIYEGYGLTETSPVVSVNREGKKRFGSVGQPLMGVDVKISAEKEILIKGPNVMRGYFNKNEFTKEVIDEYGWLHTGDLGFIDSEGFLFIIGRSKEMIVLSTGKNIWPEVVENALNGDRFITQSMVIGNKRAYLTAIVIPQMKELEDYVKEKNIKYDNLDELLEKPEVLDLYRQRIDRATEDFAINEKIVRFTLIKNEFQQKKDELTPTLKLRRDVIYYKYEREIEKMYQKS